MTTPKQDKEFVETVISTTLLEDAIEWISRNMNPEDVFKENDLETWAESNGYVKED